MACAAQAASLRALSVADKMERSLLPACRPRASFLPLASPLKLLPVGRPAPRGSASSQGDAQSGSPGGTLQEGPRGSALARQSPRLNFLDPWDPFNWSTRSLTQMMSTLDMIFDDVSGQGTDVVPFTHAPWDVLENEDNYELRIDLPGFEKDEVKVYLDEGVLVANAQSKKEESDEKKGKHSMRTRGSYLMKITLPKKCEASKINAKLHNGVLEVHIPKRKIPEHVIDVKVE